MKWKQQLFFFCSKLLWLSGLGTGLSPRRLGFVSHMEHNITLVTDHFLFLSVFPGGGGGLWLGGRASVLSSEGRWFDSPGPHVEVSHRSSCCWSAPCMAATTITVWMYACMNSCMSLWTKASLFVRYKQQTHLVLFREIWFGLKYSLFVNVKHPVFILNMLQLRIYKNTTTQWQWWSWNNTSYTSYMSDHVWIWIFISSIHFGSLIFANLPQHPVWGKSRVLGVTADIFWLGHMNSLKHEWRRVVEWLQGCLRLIIDLISHWPWGL